MNHIESKAVLLLATSIVLSACAQLFMKVSMIHLQLHVSDHPDLSAILQFIIENKSIIGWLVAGLFCYGISMLSWMFALIKYELSFAYPFLGITYILVYLGAVYWPVIGEPMSWQRTTGILLILTGVIFVNYRSPEHKTDKPYEHA